MQNIVINMREKFHYDRLRNNRALGNEKSDDNKKKKTMLVALMDPFPGPKIKPKGFWAGFQKVFADLRHVRTPKLV